MGQFEEQHKIALISCIEVVLMRKGDTRRHLVQARLSSLYNCDVRGSYEHPEYLRDVLKDVYKEDFNSIIDEIKLLLDDLVNEKDIDDFFKIMES